MPLGELDIIPGSFFTRLDHVPFGIEKAQLTKKMGHNETTFVLAYTSIQRTLAITIENKPPYKISRWEESTTKGTTSGILQKSMHIPYWQMNANKMKAIGIV